MRTHVALLAVLLTSLALPCAAADGDASATSSSPPAVDDAKLRASVKKLDVTFPKERLWVGRKGVKGFAFQLLDADDAPVAIDGELQLTGFSVDTVKVVKGKATLDAVDLNAAQVTVRFETLATPVDLPILPGWLSLLPALLAIALALLTREVIVALLSGVFAGGVLLTMSPTGFFTHSMANLVAVAADASHVKVMLFTLGIGGLVGVVAAAGGTRGAVDAVSKFAKDARSTSLSVWVMGMVVFFDDYASTLLVGNTMRPVSDKHRISREKLSYIVDSTAATITSIALASTWIGYEVSTLADAMKAAGVAGDAYKDVFVAGLPSRFYPIFALLFVGLLAYTQRDFGPMLTAERRARREGKVLRDGAEPLVDDEVSQDAEKMHQVEPRLWMALLPIGSLIAFVVLFLVVLGADASYDALLYASFLAVVVGVLQAKLVGALSSEDALKAVMNGVRSMVLAVVVLCLAWGMNQVMSQLHAGAFLADQLAGALPPWSLPTLTFVVAGVMALATGTSWGTMGILFPVVVPIAAAHVDAGSAPLFLATTSAVLAGAVLGDHCSPISDTTVLSSVAAGSDHVDHTRTQMPYALTVGVISVVCGTLPAGFGVSPWVCLVVGIAALFVVTRFVAQPIEDDKV